MVFARLWNRSHRVPLGILTANERGYTLIELLIVTGIFVVVSGVVLASNSRFGGKITLENFAYDMALSIRQAQVYSIAVRRVDVADDFGSAYGMNFTMASPATYQLFTDSFAPANGMYDPGELLQSTTMNGGYRVSDLKIRTGAESETSVSRVDITFKRPEPDAYIRKDGEPTTYEAARIIISSPRGETADIVVESTGQISIQ